MSSTDLETLYSDSVALCQQGKLFDALMLLNDALQLASHPQHQCAIRGTMAAALNGLGRHDEALAQAKLALDIEPSDLVALCAYASAQLSRHDYGACIAICEMALHSHPDHPQILYNQGGAFAGLGRNQEALDVFLAILARNPGDVRALYNSGVILDRFERYEEALAAYARAAAADRNANEPWLRGALLTAKARLCDWSDLERLIAEAADLIAAGKLAVEPFRWLSLCGDPQSQLRAARIYTAAKTPAHMARTPAFHLRQKGERLRIGYFSTDFRRHAVMAHLAQVLELHDRGRFEIYAFSFRHSDDDVQTRARAAVDHFLDVEACTASEIVAMARDAGIDIAVDLNGHTQGARLAVFAGRAAPVQINFLGYPATMGAPFIDYIVADELVIPAAQRDFYAEKVIHLPVSFQPNDATAAIDLSLTRADCGLPENAFVFCCFNGPQKIMPAMFDAWMRILHAVPRSVLWLNDGGQAGARINLTQAAEARGIAAQRLAFASTIDFARHLGRHRHADLFLDTSPFNAGATASAALLAGLPVLTFPSGAFAGRYGASVSAAAGLNELIVPDLEAYVARAVALATNRNDDLHQLRQRLAMVRQTAPLFDSVAYARQLERAFQAAYDRYRNGGTSDHLVIGRN